MRISPTLRLSISAALLAASLVLVGDLLGLFPDTRRAILDARQRVCESLAVQLSIAAGRGDTELVKQTLDIFVKRNPDTLSAAVRGAQGDILSQTPDHKKYWAPLTDDRSTFTHVLVPIFAGEARWGAVEVSFAPSVENRLGAFADTVWALALFVALAGLGAFYLVLRRALRELDPRGTVPQRIKSAFDALAEGVLILDRRGLIVLANAAFAKKTDRAADALLGMDAAKLEWRDPNSEARPDTVPWTLTLADGATSTRVLLRLARKDDGRMHAFVINSAPILDDKRRPRGAIVTFDDITALEQKNQELKDAIGLLRESESEIKRKNEELYQLASRDPLTGCLNRRALFGTLEPLYSKIETGGMVLSCLMLDIDYFKKVNDRFGHDVGDKVLKWVAETIQGRVGDNGLVCRYGGEEFCIVLPGLGIFQANGIAQEIRRTVEENASIRFGRELPVTVSVGLSSVHFGAKTSAELIHQADQALYAAKEGGRNKVVRWGPELVPPGERSATVRRRARGSDTPASDAGTEAHIGANRLQVAHRVDFVEWIEQAMRHVTPQAGRVTIISIVPNQYRRISDTLGATIGDALLTVIYQRVQEQLCGAGDAATDGKPRSLTARLGADELGVALTGINDKESVRRALNNILRALSHPLEIHGHIVHIDMSIGVAMTPEGGQTPEALLKNAAAARHHLLEHNRNEQVAFYSHEMNLNSIRRTRIVSELPQALHDGQLSLYFQPQQEIRGGKIVAWEALLRWSHPELGFILPTELVPIAEQTGLINDLGRWVLRTACLQAKAWSDAGVGVARIAVNLSTVQLQQSDIVVQVSEALAETGLSPDRLELEVTESAIMRDQGQAQRTLQRLRQLGIRISIDDFGIGYSGLSYIKDFPVDTVKIDRSFLTDVLTDTRAAKLYQAIVEMARSLGLYVIAEGIELKDELEFVDRSGCNAIQGYLLAPPMQAEQAQRMIRGTADRAAQC